MDISNRALGLLLVAAIVISIGGTVISLNKLDGISTTGMATNVTDGTVSLTVGDTLSIVLEDATIDFGTCTIPSGQSLDLDSNLDNESVNNSACDATGSGNFPDVIELRNNGNVAADVTVASDVTSADFLNDGSNSWVTYVPGVGTGACSSGLASATNVTTTGTNFCSNLAPHASNVAELSIQAHLSQTATTGGTMTLTFTAGNV